jgi:hypothetical protein
MAKTSSSFKIGKMVKLSMGSTFNKEQRLIYKNCMIDAKHSYVVNRNRKHKDPIARDNGTPTPPSEQA